MQTKYCISLQWNLFNPITEFFQHPMTSDKKVFLLTKIKPEYCDILYIPTHFPGLLVCRIRQVPLYKFFIQKLSSKIVQMYDIYCN